MPPQEIAKNVVVSLHYKLRLDDGSLVEETEADDPLVYLHGHDNIIAGLERELEGLRVGDQKKVVVEPDDGYGEYDPDDVEEINLTDLPPDLALEVGMLLAVEDEAGNEMVAEVAEIGDETVTLDFNHPMAGEMLEFEVTITDLRDATEEELAHGHVHGDDHHH
jgi:FKBP-type peptidyl-prolyl cis-trans isomerase SlyD